MALRKLGPGCLAFAAMILIASRARADTTDDVNRARDLFIEGAKLSEAGKWDAARDRFERSLKLKHAALTLYNLGIAQQETGHVVDALESYRAFLAMPEEAATQGLVPQVRAVLPKLEARVAHLDVDVKPAGVKGLALRIDGRAARPLGGPWAVDPGVHEIVAVVPGYGEVRQKTSIAEGGRASLSLSLSPLVPPNEGGLAVPIGLTVGGLALFVGGEVTFAIGAAKGLGSGASPGRSLMIAGNVVAGAGAIAAGIGVVLLVRRTPRAQRGAFVSPWANGDVGGVEIRF